MQIGDFGLGQDPLTCIRTVKRAVEQKKNNARAVNLYNSLVDLII